MTIIVGNDKYQSFSQVGGKRRGESQLSQGNSQGESQGYSQGPFTQVAFTFAATVQLNLLCFWADLALFSGIEPGWWTFPVSRPQPRPGSFPGLSYHGWHAQPAWWTALTGKHTHWCLLWDIWWWPPHGRTRPTRGIGSMDTWEANSTPSTSLSFHRLVAKGSALLQKVFYARQSSCIVVGRLSVT